MPRLDAHQVGVDFAKRTVKCEAAPARYSLALHGSAGIRIRADAKQRSIRRRTRDRQKVRSFLQKCVCQLGHSGSARTALFSPGAESLIAAPTGKSLRHRLTPQVKL